MSDDRLVTLAEARAELLRATGRRWITRALLRDGRACGLTVEADDSPAWPRVWIERDDAAEVLFAGLPEDVAGWAFPCVAPADLRGLLQPKNCMTKIEFIQLRGGALARITPPLPIRLDDLRIDRRVIAALAALALPDVVPPPSRGGRARKRWDDETIKAAARMADALQRSRVRGAVAVVARRFGVSRARLALILKRWKSGHK